MCSHSTQSSSVSQTLDELEFERGLWTAALDNDLSKCKELLAKRNDPSQRDSSGYTPLHYAARSSSSEVVQLLCDHRSDVNAQTTAGKSTPLMRAAAKGRPEIVAILIQAKSDLKIQDQDGRTALHHCCIEANDSKLECANRILNSHNSSELINVKDKFDKTARDYFSQENQIGKWSELLKS